jgi:hypothetical protein
MGAQIHRLNSNTKPTKYIVFQQLPYHLKPKINKCILLYHAPLFMKFITF